MNPAANRSSVDVNGGPPPWSSRISSQNYELHPDEVKTLALESGDHQRRAAAGCPELCGLRTANSSWMAPANSAVPW